MNHRIYFQGLARLAVAASVLATFTLLVPTGSRAQAPATRLECEHNGSDGNGRQSGLFGWFRRGNRFQSCEIREQTIAASDKLVVDASPNGGVRVSGWDRDEVLVRAAVRVWGDDEDDARDLASQIEIKTEGGRIRADGPGQSWNRMGWTVSYEIFAPHATDLDLQTVNGGIVLNAVDGDIDFDTTNGGVSLDDVAGDVRGRTTNGGIDVRLTGGDWQGDGLDLATTNGGVRLHVPEDYSARLEVRTTNGGINTDFPVSVEGQIGRRNLTATLGDGGAPVSIRTTNGAVHIMRD